MDIRFLYLSLYKDRGTEDVIMIYSAYLKGTKRTFATTSMAVLAEVTGLGYDKIAYHLSRHHKEFYQDDNVVIIKSDTLYKSRSGIANWFKSL